MRASSSFQRIGLAAAGTTAAVGAGSGLAAWLLKYEAGLARRRIGRHTDVVDPPVPSGIWGNGPGEPLTLAVLGDSTAVGRGVADMHETPGVLLAVALSELADSPVRLIVVARSGSGASALDEQVDEALQDSPDVAVIMTGTNDVTARRPADLAASLLGAAVGRLRAAECEVVVGTCPDLGTLRPVPQPLRWFGRRWSRQLAAAQIVAVVAADGRTVSMGSLIGHEFAARPDFFASDEFHPSATGYARAAAVLLPSVADALDLSDPLGDQTRPRFGRAPRSVEWAAARASGVAGTEVVPTPDPHPDRALSERTFALSRRRWPADLPAPQDVFDADRQDDDGPA